VTVDGCELGAFTGAERIDAARELTVSKEQQKFMAPVLKSIADAFVYKGAVIRVAEHEGKLVGYVMVFPFNFEGVSMVNIARSMVDHRF
jgi:hypothetical protein